MAFGIAEIGAQAEHDLRRAAVREEVGKPRLRGARGAARVEDDRRREVGVAEAGSAGDPVLGGDREGEFAQPLRRHPRRHPVQLPADLNHGIVEEGRGPGDELDRCQLRQLRAWPRDRPRPLRQLARQAALEAEELPEVGAEQELLEVSFCKHDNRVVAEVLAKLLGRPIGRRVGVDERLGAGIGRQRRREAGGDQRRQRGDRQDRPRMPDGPGGGGAQSIESGPVTSALRNCATNAFSESNSSLLGPDSTIFPFQSTARKSAIRRAVLRSWLIVR